MVYETSYESGRKPFTPDLQRGKWEKPSDYIFACCGLALKLDIFVIAYWFFFDMGFFGILPYFLYMVVYMVPLLVIHSYMGQFSTSGFISAFRLSPFFKGLGYVSVFLSTAALLSYSVFAIVPLIFITNSLRPTLPWSCESIHAENHNLTTLCNITAIANEFEDMENDSISIHTTVVHIPSVLYFKQHFDTLAGEYLVPDEKYEMSWTVMFFAVVVWSIVAGIFYRFSETAQIGKLLRYMILTVLVLMVICFVRFLFLPGALDGLLHYVKPRRDTMVEGAIVMSVVVLQAFGAGWGTIMTLSSFNKFDTNIMNYSWVISFGQTLVYILFGMVTFMIEHYFEAMKMNRYDVYVEVNWLLYLSTASALASLEFPNLWTIIYYTMLLLASLVVMITQIFTILTALFDEFEVLRANKERVTFGIIGFLAVCSLPFCTNHGIVYFSAVSLDSIITHCIMHLILLLAVLWVYGRERFQRDIEFMLGQPFASWKIFLLRFIAPLFLIYSLLVGLFMATVEHAFSSSFVLVLSLFLVILPMLFIPGYGIFMMFQTTGGFCERFRRACRPTDWYPLEMENRQRYEEAIGNSDITHQLCEVTEEVN